MTDLDVRSDAPLGELPALLRDEPGLTRALGDPSARLAVVEVARPISIAALATLSSRRPLVVSCPTGTMAGQLADDLAQFLPPGDVVHFPGWETLPFERVSPNVETMGQRLDILWRLRDPDRCPAVIVAGVRALLQKLGPGATTIEPIIVRPGADVDPDALGRRLVEFGYRREELVEHRGEFARRGAIVDVFPSTADAPIRIDLWGDEVDRLTRFGVNDQRSTDDLDEVCIFPARELMPTDEVRRPRHRARRQRAVGSRTVGTPRRGGALRRHGELAPLARRGRPADHRRAPDAARVLLVEPRRMRDRALDLIAEEDDLARTLASTWARDPDKSFPRLHADPATLLDTAGAFWSIDSTPESPDTPLVEASGWGPVAGDGSGLTDRLIELIGRGFRVVVAADGTGSAQRLHDLLLNNGLDFPVVQTGAPLRPGGSITVAPLHRGVTLPNAKLAIVAESDLTGRRRAHRAIRKAKRESASTFEDLKAGSFVVHHQHGVGKYEGMVKRAIGGVERDYLLIAYKGGDKLYVPSDQIDTLRQYVGGEAPKLHKLGGSDFAKTKSKVRSAVREIAQELVVLYQKRVNATGHSFGQDTPWQAEMEEAFPYVETPDQRTAIEAIKSDMELAHPMDRLLCGDVGFGKTEVAIRAAFKAIQDGKQVAVLAPTTLLATQHGNTFADRFAGFPIRVETLSRFLTAGQAKQVIEGVKSGEVDCVIGTHRLLANDVKFKDLGLLVVDEEQRFGVQHKETMKKMKTNVDVLTLSATPIPRTLEMSLVGIRDLSLLQTPPAERMPILTYVGEYDERVAIEAIRRELLREGQVFWVHNRVQSIETAASRLRELVPEARIAIAHGQMDEARLETVVQDFWDGQYDVLVCTTIIESGIDMPTVNTLVVERSDLLGLGQMHQLRGRVGRSGSAPTPTCSIHATRCSPRRRTSGCARSARRPIWALVQDRDARPRDPRRRQPARRVAEWPHRGRRLRPVLPDGHRGGERDEGRTAAGRAERDQARRADRLLPAHRLRREGRTAPGGVSPAGRRHHRRGGRRHPHRVGGPVRAAAGARRGAAAGGLPARRVPPAGHQRHPDLGFGVEWGKRTARTAGAEAQRDDAPAPDVEGCEVQGGPGPAGGPTPPRHRPQHLPLELPARPRPRRVTRGPGT
jgi:transcription-repair coupling factor (superfamily II helicase)